ncbi:MAG: hypothetical protein J7K08_04820 [Thermoplasmata archaeon]|nr:hypothetical protein [Thermoplasmata archaeon]
MRWTGQMDGSDEECSSQRRPPGHPSGLKRLAEPKGGIRYDFKEVADPSRGHLIRLPASLEEVPY